MKTKCIITVVALMASGITDSSLSYHLQNAKAHGVTKEEIAGTGDWQSCISRIDCTHTKFYTVHACHDLGTDSDRVHRTGSAGGACFCYHYRTEKAHGE